MRLTRSEWIAKARAMHGSFYDYSKSNYIGSLKNITITCPLHGDFSQRASSHLAGSDCPVCANARRNMKRLRTMRLNRLANAN